jgi:hypothetical protein
MEENDAIHGACVKTLSDVTTKNGPRRKNAGFVAEDDREQIEGNYESERECANKISKK